MGTPKAPHVSFPLMRFQVVDLQDGCCSCSHRRAEVKPCAGGLSLLRNKWLQDTRQDLLIPPQTRAFGFRVAKSESWAPSATLLAVITDCPSLATIFRRVRRCYLRAFLLNSWSQVLLQGHSVQREQCVRSRTSRLLTPPDCSRRVPGHSPFSDPQYWCCGQGRHAEPICHICNLFFL